MMPFTACIFHSLSWKSYLHRMNNSAASSEVLKNEEEIIKPQVAECAAPSD